MEQKDIDNKLRENNHQAEYQVVLKIRLSDLVVLGDFSLLWEEDDKNQNDWS